MADKVDVLAADLGVSRDQAVEFVLCLGVWTSKGYSVAEAIQQNLATLHTLLDRTSDGLDNELSLYRPSALAMKAHLADSMWGTVNATLGGSR